MGFFRPAGSPLCMISERDEPKRHEYERRYDAVGFFFCKCWTLPGVYFCSVVLSLLSRFL
jgi:hypothetical protein